MGMNYKKSQKRRRNEELVKKNIKKIKKIPCTSGYKANSKDLGEKEYYDEKELDSSEEETTSIQELDSEEANLEGELNSEEETNNIHELSSEEGDNSEEGDDSEEGGDSEEKEHDLEECDGSEEEESNEENNNVNGDDSEEDSNENEDDNEDKLSSEEEDELTEVLDSEEESNDKELSTEDPYFCHFNGNLPKDKEPQVEDQTNWKTEILNWPHLGRLSFSLPKIDQTIIRREKKLLDDDSDDIFLPKIGVLPNTPSPKAFDAITNGFVHKKLINKINQKAFSGQQSEIYTLLSNYLDFWHTEASHEKWDKIRRVLAIHCLNHLFKARDQILKHNNIVQKWEKKNELPPRLEDQGFTRPRILILQPFRNSAYKLIKAMINLLEMEVQNKKEFEDYYGPPKEEEKINNKKPDDFLKVFDGDINDNFIAGITLCKKTIKLELGLKVKRLIKCDIIIASPLRLRQMLDGDNEKIPSADRTDAGETSEAFLKAEYMLSSIEIFIIDQADIIFMQNWEHVTIIEKALNTWPKELRELNIDIYRMHRWYFEKQARYFRQTIIFSSTSSDFIRGVSFRAKNVTGKVELRNRNDGVLSDIKVHADLTMLCIRKNDPNMTDFDATFAYFTKELLPRLRKNNSSHVLIYIPDYFDYVRLNHFFHKDGGVSFATINEYMIEENSKVAKARSLFYDGKKKYLLYTERFHFYRRYKIKGVRHVVFYSPPLYPHFFKEVCELLSEEYQNPKHKFNSISYIYLLYNLSDKSKLNELIGTNKTLEISRSGKNYHSYLTGI